MLLLGWSNNNVIHGSQRRYFFHETKVVRLEKKGIVYLLSSVSTIGGKKFKVKTPASTLTKTAFHQNNCNVKERLWACKKKSVRCNRKATFQYKGKSQEVFRAGLNEIKYDCVASKQHFYLQYHVAATENRHETTLQKTNDTSSSSVPRVYPAWGQTQFKRSQPVGAA